ncbi:MAG: serine hydrolase, partial [Prolixibacteraceae bacterium]|nr:serine hydrolase [Prolixibacteraceae bacterium]
IDSVSLRKMVNLINENHYGKINSVLIAKNGKLIFEKYFDGFWTDDLHSLQSCTKSIGSLLIGIAIDKNYINSVDQKVMEFFPEYASGCDPGWNKIKLEHLLTMSMGLKWDRNYHDAIYDISDDVIISTFGQEVLYSPGEKFEYRNPQTDLISGIIINTTKNSVQDFAKINLFDPLGIKKFYWPNFKNNDYCLMSGSLALQSRDMLKIGQLIINEGKWGNSQIISKNYINESVTFKIKTDQGFDYGYLWWLGESEFQKELKAIFAMGISGQLIVIIPETEMVIVTTSDNTGNTPELLLKMIDEYIIKNTVFL